MLASAVRRAIAHAAGCHDYAYSRPGRRRIPRIVTPALRRPLVTVAVVVDTSGSMGQSELDAALAEVKGVITAAGIGTQRLMVLACDAAVGATSRVRRVEDVQLVGGGGTDMRVGIAAAEASRPHPDVIVVFTDGYTPWPDRPTRARLVVAIIGAQVDCRARAGLGDDRAGRRGMTGSTDQNTPKHAGRRATSGAGRLRRSAAARHRPGCRRCGSHRQRTAGPTSRAARAGQRTPGRLVRRGSRVSVALFDLGQRLRSATLARPVARSTFAPVLPPIDPVAITLTGAGDGTLLRAS